MKKLYCIILAIAFFSCKGKVKVPVKTADSSPVAIQAKPKAQAPPLNNDSLNLNGATWLAHTVYDTVANQPQTDDPADTITRDDVSLKYYEDISGKYYVYVVENRGPMYGVSTGWCDVFIFKRADGTWTLNDMRLKAGGGGMYGNPGTFEKLEKTGTECQAIVISGGQSHMGSNYNLTLIELTKGKLGKTFGFSTRHDYGEGAGDDYKLTVCDENEYHFEQVPGKAHYDLILERFNCLGDPSVKTDSAIIPYKDGYKIPERFSFDE